MVSATVAVMSLVTNAMNVKLDIMDSLIVLVKYIQTSIIKVDFLRLLFFEIQKSPGLG